MPDADPVARTAEGAEGGPSGPSAREAPRPDVGAQASRIAAPHRGDVRRLGAGAMSRSVLALQRSAGNRATLWALARGPFSSPDPVVTPRSTRPPLLDPGEFQPWFDDADQLQP